MARPEVETAVQLRAVDPVPLWPDLASQPADPTGAVGGATEVKRGANGAMRVPRSAWVGAAAATAPDPALPRAPAWRCLGWHVGGRRGWRPVRGGVGRTHSHGPMAGGVRWWRCCTRRKPAVVTGLSAVVAGRQW
uniref:Uncharacterized protein n=1 Tax=Oryza barthii TaxID=65489 RepID=A0A0D3GS04_9ORYZ